MNYDKNKTEEEMLEKGRMLSKKEIEEDNKKNDEQGQPRTKKGGCSSCKKRAEERAEERRLAREASEEEVLKHGPSIIKQAANLTRAMSKHVAGGLKEVGFADYADRLNVCKGCELRDKNKCTDCGCFLLKKAWWRSEDCPKGKWKKQE